MGILGMKLGVRKVDVQNETNELQMAARKLLEMDLNMKYEEVTEELKKQTKYLSDLNALLEQLIEKGREA